MFYFIESVLAFPFISWFGTLLLENKNGIQGVVKVCTNITGMVLNDISGLDKVSAFAKGQKIPGTLDLTPCLGKFLLLPSCQKCALPRCKTNALKNFYITAAIAFLNWL